MTSVQQASGASRRVPSLRAALGVLRAPRTDVWALPFLARVIGYRLVGRRIYAHSRVRIRGLGRVLTEARLYIGTQGGGVIMKTDPTFLNVRGRLLALGDAVTIGRGTRVDIGPDAVCRLEDCSIGRDCRLILSDGMEVGSGTLVSWCCEFLDADWHTCEFEGRRNRDAGIRIGNNVWIGYHVLVLKGVHIPDGCVVAAGSVLTRAFEEPNSLIAGNPARVVKRDVTWT